MVPEARKVSRVRHRCAGPIATGADGLVLLCVVLRRHLMDCIAR